MGPPPAPLPAPADALRPMNPIARAWWNLSLRKKVLVLVAVPALSMVTPTAVTIGLDRHQDSLRREARAQQMVRNDVIEINNAAESADLAVHRFALSRDPADLAPLDEFAATYAEDLAAVAAAGPDEFVADVERLDRLAASLVATSGAMRDAVDGGDVDPAVIAAQQDAASELETEMIALLERFEARSAAFRDDVDDASQRVQRTLIIGIAISLVASGIASWLFVRSIVRRIQVIQELTAHVVAGGELQHVTPPSHDELGVLASELAEAARQLISAHVEAAQSRDAALEATKAKDEFLSRMSHELRTPLTAILGFGQLLQMEDTLGEEDRRAVDQIVKAGRHLLELINDLLDISRIATGHLALSLEPVVVADVVDGVIGLLQPQATERSVRVTSTVDPALCVTADHQRVRQVLLNLVSNAIKYNSSPGTVGVGAERSGDGPEHTVVVSVTDSGPGISPESQRRLFQPFERLETTSAVEGTGVGLALSKSLVEAMGGTIGLDSVVGRGSRFWIALHAAPDAPMGEPAIALPPAPVRRRGGGAAPVTVLYVEDNLANVRVVERFLEGRGVRLEVAMQGHLAVELAREVRPDLVLLDLHLPDQHGADVFAALRADERTASVPIVILTADATDGGQRRFLEAGAFDYLTKPIDLERLGSIVDTVSAQRRDV